MLEVAVCVGILVFFLWFFGGLIYIIAIGPYLEVQETREENYWGRELLVTAKTSSGDVFSFKVTNKPYTEFLSRETVTIRTNMDAVDALLNSNKTLRTTDGEFVRSANVTAFTIDEAKTISYIRRVTITKTPLLEDRIEYHQITRA